MWEKLLRECSPGGGGIGEHGTGEHGAGGHGVGCRGTGTVLERSVMVAVLGGVVLKWVTLAVVQLERQLLSIILSNGLQVPVRGV